MEYDLWAGVAGLTLLAALMVATSSTNAAWSRLNRVRLRHLAAEGVAGSRSLLKMIEESPSTHVMLTVANAGSLALTAGLAATLDTHYFAGSPPAFYASAALGILAVLWIQLASHWAGSLHPEATLFLLLTPIRVLHFLLRPIIVPLEKLTRLVMPVDVHQALDGTNSQTDEDLRMIVDAVEDEGTLEEGEREMIHSIFQLGERTARESMVPRVDVAAVEASEPLRRVLIEIEERGHSRIPIYEESIDNIVGIVYAKDLLRHMEAGSLDEPARILARPPHFIPESKKIDELLREMQHNKVHIAVVLDEYGGTAGIVTIEDLLEEIVGEIQDEYDTEEITVEKLSDREAVFDARVSIRDVNDVLDISLEDEGYDTVGGLVYDRLGKIPVVGDEIRVNGLWLTVLSTLGKRIKKVKITVEPDAAREQSYTG